MRHRAGARQLAHDGWIGGFLKDDDVRVAGTDDVGQRMLAPGASPANVVSQQSKRQSAFSTSVKYGWPMSSPRRYITKSRVPWMLTGRLTIAISRLRKGTSLGAMSRS